MFYNNLYIPTLLSRKQKTFYRVFIPFLKSTSNSEYFEKKDDSYSLGISDIIDCGIGGQLNV